MSENNIVTVPDGNSAMSLMVHLVQWDHSTQRGGVKGRGGEPATTPTSVTR